jgi:hypothetical protein
MHSKIIPLRAQQPAVSHACRWHEAIESVTASNLRLVCAWQRIVWRALWAV